MSPQEISKVKREARSGQIADSGNLYEQALIKHQAELSYKAGYEKALKDYQEVLKEQGTQFNVYDSGRQAGVKEVVGYVYDWHVLSSDDLFTKYHIIPTGIYEWLVKVV